MSVSEDEHIEMIQELFLLDVSVFEEIGDIKAKRRKAENEKLGRHILGLLLETSIAKEKGFSDAASLKAALAVTGKSADVKGAQGMLFSTFDIPPPPKMLPSSTLCERGQAVLGKRSGVVEGVENISN